MLDLWGAKFDFDHWQHFIRQIKGRAESKLDCAIVNAHNFELFTDKLQKQLPGYTEQQVKRATAVALLGSVSVDSELLKQRIIPSPPPPITDELLELHKLGLMDLETLFTGFSTDEQIAICTTSGFGRYIAAARHERMRGRFLSEIDLVEFGLSSNLCKLKRVERTFIVR
ncbi:hypothetical protein K6Y31_20205 [Motilimonas cestriensis]|uniref:Uncharacterized protein n=1 Tax=Motilimonas cestriensis TaxID=2742685 RepID=A0ABS8WHI9_9GAMM|nr:hypothetical protein [Motilimonas cestriensis]MCE2597101.1 hypothetical protein [Motilimonas cestriensis]